MSKQKDSLHHKAIEVWMDYYTQQTGQKYFFLGAKDGTAIKQLLTKVKAKCEEKSIDPTEENILNSLRGFLFSLKDQWILDNLEIAIVNSKFNSLYAKAIKSSPFGRRQQIDDILAGKYRTGS